MFENNLEDGKKQVGVRVDNMTRGNTIEGSDDGNSMYKFTSQFVKKSGEPNFIKLYLQDAIALSEIDILKDTSLKSNVLYRMLHWLDWSNEIMLNTVRREEICKDCNISADYLKKIIKAFVSSQVLFQKFTKDGKPVRNTYVANPYFFGKGDWTNVFKLRLTIEYDRTRKRFIQLDKNPDLQLDLPMDM